MLHRPSHYAGHCAALVGEALWFEILALLLIGSVAGLYRWRIRNLRTQRLRNSKMGSLSAPQIANTELRRRVSELSALNQTAQALTEWTDLPVALQAVGTTIAGLFDGIVGIWLLDDRRLSLTRLISATSEETFTDKASLQLINDPVTKQVIDRAETCILEPSEELPAIAQPPQVPCQACAGGVMLVPMTSRGTIIGVLCVRGIAQDKAFTTSDTVLAQTVSGTLANAIENARLFARAQLAAAEEERQRLARELHDSVSQALYAASLTADVLPELWEQSPERG